MTMRSSELERVIITKVQKAARSLKPNEVLDVKVTQTPREDGSVEYNIEERRGPLEVKEEDLQLLARGIAEAVVEFISASATITGTGVGSDWRIR